jgi:hypothetical protein
VITSFEVGSVFKLVDQFSPTLKRITSDLKAFNALAKEAREQLSSLSRVRLSGLSDRIKNLAADAAAMRGAFGTTFDTMNLGVATALNDTRALAAEWRAVAASAAGASRAVAAATRAGVAARAAAGGAGGHGGGGGVHVSSLGVPIPGGHARIRVGGNAAMAGLGALAYGVYEESKIEDIAARALITGQIKIDQNMRQSDAFKQVRDLIRETSTKTGYDPSDVGEAILTTERQFGGLDFRKRLDIERTLLPIAAAEARMKETTLPEAFKALVGLIHSTGTFKPEQLPELGRQFAYASMITPVPLPQFERALSYSLPILHAGMGMDPGVAMLLTAMTETAGITNTKSGTWIREYFQRMMFDPKDTKQAHAHNAILEQYGLLKDKHPTWWVKDAAGKTDWSASIEKLSTMMSAMLAEIPDDQRMGVMRAIWGAQGGGFASLMNLPQFVEQMPVLAQAMKTFKGGENVIDQLFDASPVQQARTAFSDLKLVLMDIGSIALPPFTAALKDIDAILKRIGGILPTPGTQGSSVASGAMTGGLIGAIGIPFGVGAATVPLGAAIGGFWGGSSYLQSQPTASWSDWWSSKTGDPGYQLFGLPPSGGNA